MTADLWMILMFILSWYCYGSELLIFVLKFKTFRHFESAELLATGLTEIGLYLNTTYFIFISRFYYCKNNF